MNAIARVSADSTAPRVYSAISQVMAALAKNGIGKDRKNQAQNYAFRGIDDVYNALASALVAAKLVMLPEVMERACEERQTKNGGTLFYTTVHVAFELVSAEDGSHHRIVTFGEAMDSADKSTNKAMSAAYKYAALQAFCIPTEGDNDADATTHDVAPKPAPAKPADAPLDERVKKAEAAYAGVKSSDDWTKVETKCRRLRDEVVQDAPDLIDRLDQASKDAWKRVAPPEWLDPSDAAKALAA